MVSKNYSIKEMYKIDPLNFILSVLTLWGIIGLFFYYRLLNNHKFNDKPKIILIIPNFLSFFLIYIIYFVYWILNGWVDYSQITADFLIVTSLCLLLLLKKLTNKKNVQDIPVDFDQENKILMEKRRIILKKMSMKAKRISAKYLAEQLEFNNMNDLITYIINLPDNSPFKLDGDEILIELENKTNPEIESEIDKLLASFNSNKAKL